MPQSTYRDQFTKLVDRGYLVQRGNSSTYDFYETPQRDACLSKDNTSDDIPKTEAVNIKTPENREININNINNTNVEKQVSQRMEFNF